MARLVSYAVAGVEPAVMGIGPVPAIRECLGKCGLTVSDMDGIELNEAFAAQALAVIREHELPLDKTNPNGSGISLGHPDGATGCIITIKAKYIDYCSFTITIINIIRIGTTARYTTIIFR